MGYLKLHGELPGLINHLRTHLQRVINRRIVEPNRRRIDIQRIYYNKHVLKVGAYGCMQPARAVRGTHRQAGTSCSLLKHMQRRSVNSSK